MTPDIVERLRSVFSKGTPRRDLVNVLCLDAADEIERLRRELLAFDERVNGKRDDA